jgi:hypothetical protein
MARFQPQRVLHLHILEEDVANDPGTDQANRSYVAWRNGDFTA